MTQFLTFSAKNLFDSAKTAFRITAALFIITGPLLALPALGAGTEMLKTKGGGAVLIVSLQRGR